MDDKKKRDMQEVDQVEEETLKRLKESIDKDKAKIFKFFGDKNLFTVLSAITIGTTVVVKKHGWNDFQEELFFKVLKAFDKGLDIKLQDNKYEVHIIRTK